jgi:MoxR-like ATPase
MALAGYLIPGFQYIVTGGIFEGQTVTIVDNHPFPDKDNDGNVVANRRKITVRLEDGSTEYILPRMISDDAVGIDHPTIVAVPEVPSAPMVVTTEVDGEEATVEADRPVIGPGIKPITDPMDSRLDQFRPKRAIVKKYVSRVMPNGMTDVEMFLQFTSDAYRAKNDTYPRSAMIHGDTQCGKTMFVQVLACLWADLLGYNKPMPVFTLSGSAGVTDYDLFGQPANYTDPVTGQSMIVWLPGIVDLAFMAGGILYLDEPNAMGERVTSSLHPVIDHRHSFINRAKPVFKGGVFMPETVKAPADLWVLGSMNDMYGGMIKLNEAFKGRFGHIVWEYDADVEAELIHSPAIRLMGERLRMARKSGVSIRTPVGTSMLQAAEVDARVLGPEMAMEMVISVFEPPERGAVREIIDAASIEVLLGQEAMQREMDDERIADHQSADNGVAEASNDLAGALGLNIKPPKF